jgi:hypothetical protein
MTIEMMAPPIANRVEHDQAGNEQRKERREREQEKVQRVDPTGHGRRLLGK